MNEEELRAELNAKVGRIYYQSLTDAEGYPNGMALWSELSARDRYFFTVTALSFLEYLNSAKIDVEKVGIRKPAIYGEGDCKALLDYFAKEIKNGKT